MDRPRGVPVADERGLPRPSLRPLRVPQSSMVLILKFPRALPEQIFLDESDSSRGLVRRSDRPQ